MATRRRKARIVAIQALYEADVAGHSPQDTLERLIAQNRLSEASEAFARELVTGVLEQRQHIDGIIARAAPAWPIEQLAPIDRNILRVAIFEMLVDNGTPIRAAINEAVELAKSYGSDSSPRFVNGVLGSVSLMVAR
jgi:N utilization substance protein B